MVVPVLMTSCHVSENPKTGPDTIHTRTTPAASTKAVVLPDDRLVALGPHELLGLLAREQITLVELTTVHWHALVREVAAAGERLPRSLRLLLMGGERAAPQSVAAWQRFGVPLVHVYGLTEASYAVAVRRPFLDNANSVGKPVDGIVIKVDGTADVPGEILVKGRGVVAGYWNDERSPEVRFEDGWLRTGDSGVLDADGYLSIVGRTKEIIIRGGLNIAPREIEDLLCELDVVRAAAVIGVPDVRLGEVTCACLVLEEGASLSLDEAVAHLRARELATYKLPQVLLVVDALPTTPSGKIRKNELRETIDLRHDA